MAKVIDITDKLNFEEAPSIRIKGVDIEINNKAVDMLKITPTLKKNKMNAADIYILYQTLFSEEAQKKIEALNLNMKDLGVAVVQATYLLGDIAEGETLTPAMT